MHAHTRAHIGDAYKHMQVAVQLADDLLEATAAVEREITRVKTAESKLRDQRYHLGVYACVRAWLCVCVCVCVYVLVHAQSASASVFVCVRA